MWHIAAVKEYLRLWLLNLGFTGCDPQQTSGRSLHLLLNQISAIKAIPAARTKMLPTRPLCGDSGKPMSQRGALKIR